MIKSTGFKGLISLLLVMCLMVSTFGTAYVPTEAAVNKNISIVRIVKYKNSLKVKFKVNKTKKISGYQVQASTSKKFKKAKTKSVKVKASKRAAKVKKLRKNTKYFVRVRSYTKKKNGKVKYSKWSKVKSAKTLTKNIENKSDEYNEQWFLNSIAVDPKYVKQIVKEKLGIDNKGRYVLYNEKYNIWSIYFEIDSKNQFASAREQEYLKLLGKVYVGLNITNSMSDIDKAMIISRWINDNIEYAYDKNGNPDHSYSLHDTLKHGKAICSGYSKLMEDLLFLADIPAKYITLKSVNHAEVAIKFWGYWFVTDPTGGGLCPYGEIDGIMDVEDCRYIFYSIEEMQEYYKKIETTPSMWRQVCERYVNNHYLATFSTSVRNKNISIAEDICYVSGGSLKDLVPQGSYDIINQHRVELGNAYILAQNHKAKSRTEILKS